MDAVYEKFQNGGKINGIPLVLLSIKFFFLVYESIYKSLELFDLEEEEEFRLLVYFQSYQILFCSYSYVLQNTVTFLIHVITVPLIGVMHGNRFYHCFYYRYFQHQLPLVHPPTCTLPLKGQGHVTCGWCPPPSSWSDPSIPSPSSSQRSTSCWTKTSQRKKVGIQVNIASVVIYSILVRKVHVSLINTNFSFFKFCIKLPV